MEHSVLWGDQKPSAHADEDGRQRSLAVLICVGMCVCVCVWRERGEGGEECMSVCLSLCVFACTLLHCLKDRFFPSVSLSLL